MELIIECISSPQTHFGSACSILFSSFSSCDFDYSQSRTDLRSELFNSFFFSALGSMVSVASCSDSAIGEGLLLKAKLKCVCLVVGFKPLLSGKLGLLLQLSLRPL